jgi:hypothetical protein
VKASLPNRRHHFVVLHRVMKSRKPKLDWIEMVLADRDGTALAEDAPLPVVNAADTAPSYHASPDDAAPPTEACDSLDRLQGVSD